MSRSKLSVILTTVFLLVMFMGPGPGLRLINPDINASNPDYTFAGIPTIYAWGLFWYCIQLIIVLIAYFKLWSGSDEPATEEAQ